MAAMGWPDGRRRTRGRHGPSASVSNRRLLRPTSSPWWRLAHHGVDTAMMLNKIEKQEFVLRSDVRPRGWASQKKYQEGELRRGAWFSRKNWVKMAGRRRPVAGRCCPNDVVVGEVRVGILRDFTIIWRTSLIALRRAHRRTRRKRWRRRAADNRGTSATNTAWWQGGRGTIIAYRCGHFFISARYS